MDMNLRGFNEDLARRVKGQAAIEGLTMVEWMERAAAQDLNNYGHESPVKKERPNELRNGGVQRVSGRSKAAGVAAGKRKGVKGVATGGDGELGTRGGGDGERDADMRRRAGGVSVKVDVPVAASGSGVKSCGECGAMGGQHQKWCSKKDAKR